MSALLFWQKIEFLKILFVTSTYPLEYYLLVVINAATYIAIISWVYFLLRQHSTFFLKVYVFSVGVLFSLFTRAIEKIEIVSRQGIDYDLAQHFLLAVLGREGMAEIVVKFSFQWGVFFILFLGIAWKLYLNYRRSLVLKITPLIILLIGVGVSFISPEPNVIPRSLGQNSLVYLVKTAWLPIPNIKLDYSVPHDSINILSAQRELTATAISSKKSYLELNAQPKTDLNIELNTKPDQESQAELYIQNQQNDYGIAQGMNVAIIVLESTSANTLPFYPSAAGVKGSTPFMEGLSQHSLFMNETSAIMASTTKSLVTILCGIEPYLGSDVFEATLGVPVDCLAKRLSDRGYDTTFFQTATKNYEGRDGLVEHLGIKRFFSIEDINKEALENKRKIGVLGYEDEVLLDSHRAWLKNKAQNKNEPFMTFYLTLAQHYPYLPVSNINLENENVKNEQAEKKQIENQLIEKEKDNPYLSQFSHSLSYIDGYLEKIIDQYKLYGLYENTLFVFVGDHGEGFGRYHRPWFHNNILYREGVWVPFFIANESLFEKQRKINGEFSLMDVAPTIEYLLGIEKYPAYRGINVLDDKQENSQVFSYCWYPNRCISVTDENYKYIYNFNDSPDELFDRKNDFREQHNIIESHTELAEAYKKLAVAWYNETLLFYDIFYRSIDNNYLTNPESFFQFPSEIFSDHDELTRW